MSELQLMAAALIAALIFCLVRAVADLRAKRFGWAAASLLVGVVLLAALLQPIETRAVRVDLSSGLAR